LIFSVTHGSHVLYVISFCITFNSNLDGGGYEGAIEFNWEVNCSNQKFGGNFEKGVKVQGSKV
jgi:hypothetical protein